MEADMSDNTQKSDEKFVADINISGPGIISVSSADVVRTPEGQRQIKALEELVNKDIFSKMRAQSA